MSPYRPTLPCVAAALLLSCAWLPAGAQAPAGYPNKAIHVVVPSPAGGPPDLIARMITPKLAAAFGQPVVVENRPGAGGMLGTGYVAKAAPDGYTILITTASHTAIPAFSTNVPYDAVKDFSPITLLAQNYGQVLVVRPTLAAKTVPELVALAKAQPGKLNYGSAGAGTASHIPAEVMKSQAGLFIVDVPYRGVSEAMTDLQGGHIDMFFVGTQIALPLVQQNRVRALAVTGAQRWKGMPDTPTMQESGFKDFNVVNWFGAWLPAGAPPELVARLQAEMSKAMQEPDVQKQFDTLGLQAVGSSPQDFARFVQKDAAFTAGVARRIQGVRK